MPGTTSILPPFAFGTNNSGYSNTQLDLLDKIYQAIIGTTFPEFDVSNGYQGGWVLDQQNEIHWLEIVTVGDTTTYNYYDAPGGTTTTPIGVVVPTNKPNIQFNTIRIDGDSATQTATPYKAARQNAPGSPIAAVTGTVGREYTIESGFRFLSIVFLPECEENKSLTINGLQYGSQFGDSFGRSLLERGARNYSLKIDEEYTIVAGAGMKIEITEVR